MGIDIFMKWENQTQAERERQSCWADTTKGHTGYLREAYHGPPYATKYLLKEVFESDQAEASIPARKLKERLPKTLRLVEKRARSIYKADSKEVERAKKSFIDFVALAENKERETGKPVRVWASY